MRNDGLSHFGEEMRLELNRIRCALLPVERTKTNTGILHSVRDDGFRRKEPSPIHLGFALSGDGDLIEDGRPFFSGSRSLGFFVEGVAGDQGES